jgi:four helix bundle protein
MGPKKNVYVRALDVVGELGPLVEAVQRRDRKLADQLRRAAQSVVLNIAEARGNRDGNARLRFSTACGSAKETRAALTIASAWGYIDARRVAPLDKELDEVCAITWVLGKRG